MDFIVEFTKEVIFVFVFQYPGALVRWIFIKRKKNFQAAYYWWPLFEFIFYRPSYWSGIHCIYILIMVSVLSYAAKTWIVKGF